MVHGSDNLSDEGRIVGGPPANRGSIALSAAQLGIWFDGLTDPEAANHNIAEYVEICGPVDPVLFEKALRIVVMKADTLSIRMINDPAGPRQVIGEGLEWSMSFMDVSGERDPRAAAETWMRADIERVIDPVRDPLFTYALFRAAPDRYFWYRRYHHIVLDGFGAALIAQRLAQVYTELSAGAEPSKSPFGSFLSLVEEDAAYRESRSFVRDKEFWLKSLADCPEPSTLTNRRCTKSATFLRQTAYLSRSAADNLRAFAERAGASVAQVITAATAIFVNRMTGAEEVVLGYSVSGRISALSRRTPGMVTNVVPLRLDVTPDMEVTELLDQAKHRLFQALRYQRYRIADMRRDLGRMTQPIYGPLVNVMPFDYDLRFAGHRAIQHNMANGAVEDLSITVYDGTNSNEIRVDINANPTGYSKDTLVEYHNRFVTLLNALAEVGTPQNFVSRAGELPLLTESERRQLLAARSTEMAAYTSDACLHQLFERQAERRGTAVAVNCGSQQISYQELNARANRLAHLLRQHGVGREVVVGLCLDRGIDLIVGVLGILKAGGAYLPIDVAYPKDRVAFMLKDAQVSVIVTDAGAAANIPAQGSTIVLLDDPASTASYPSTNPGYDCSADDLAYTIFTSGSTGNPKGALISHQNVVRLFLATEKWFGFNEDDVWTLFHSPAFDFSVWEIWGALLNGGRLVIVPYIVSRSPDAFRRLLADEKVTVLNQTPSAFNQLINADAVEPMDLSLRYVVFGGEALNMRNLQPWFDRHGDRRPQLINMYGITETTVHVTYRPLTKADVHGGSVVGIPIPDLQVYILDSRLEPVPIGVAGEMFVGGAGLARGYLNRPELTRDRFIANPFSEQRGARLYRTGDLARLIEGGEIEYLGRIDHQVKIRGFRIELGEIEAAVKLCPGVRDAAVLVREDVPGDKRIVAYVTSNAAGNVDISEFHNILKRQLPEYMVPSAFVTIDAMPLNHNGKLDRRALPRPERVALPSARSDYVAPRTRIEAVMADIWSSVLGIDKVGIHDNFFEIGGQSILAVKTIFEINQALEATLGVAALFRHPTIEQLAREIPERGQASTANFAVVPLREGSSTQPIYFIYAGSYEFKLAQMMGEEHPVFGLDVPLRSGWRIAAAQNLRSELPTMEELVKPYVAALTAHARSKPCILAGYCFAGLIAFEVARQFQMNGGTIEKIILVDSIARIPSLTEVAMRKWRSAWARKGAASADRLPGSAEAPLYDTWLVLKWLLLRGARTGWNSLRDALQMTGRGGNTSIRDEYGTFLDLRAMWRLYEHVYQTYRPAPLELPGILILAEPTDEFDRLYREFDYSLGWRPLLKQLEIIPVTGSHLAMIDQEEHKTRLSRRLRAVFEST